MRGVQQKQLPAWLAVVAASWLALGTALAWAYLQRDYLEHTFTTSLLMSLGIAAFCGLAARYRWPVPLALLAVPLIASGRALEAYQLTWWPVTVSLTGLARRAAKQSELEAWPNTCAAAGGWLAGFAVCVVLVTKPCCGEQTHWVLIGAPVAGALIAFALAARQHSAYPNGVQSLAFEAARGLARLALLLVLLALAGWAMLAGEAQRYQDRWRNVDAAP
jgi:hypothetical protein